MSAPLPIARLALNLGVNVGVSKVIYDVIRNNVTIVSPVDVVKVWTGTLIIGSIVADHATKHVNNYVDQAIAWHEGRKATLTVVESD